MGQEIATFVTGAATVAFLVWHHVRRRNRATCCGAAECPAAKELVRRLARPGARAAASPPGGGATTH